MIVNYRKKLYHIYPLSQASFTLSQNQKAPGSAEFYFLYVCEDGLTIDLFLLSKETIKQHNQQKERIPEKIERLEGIP